MSLPPCNGCTLMLLLPITGWWLFLKARGVSSEGQGKLIHCMLAGCRLRWRARAAAREQTPAAHSERRRRQMTSLAPPLLAQHSLCTPTSTQSRPAGRPASPLPGRLLSRAMRGRTAPLPGRAPPGSRMRCPGTCSRIRRVASCFDEPSTALNCCGQALVSTCLLACRVVCGHQDTGTSDFCSSGYCARKPAYSTSEADRCP